MGKHIRFDWAIKKLLRNKSNYEILEGFLSELIGEELRIDAILESESNKELEIDKFNRVDILVKTVVGELVLIEVQNEREHDYFHRMCYGTSKIISENLFSGDTYDKVKKVYSINIVYFDLGFGTDYVYIGNTHFNGLHTNESLELSAKQKELYKIQFPHQVFPTYYILKLKNFHDILENTLDEWIYFLKNSEILDHFRAKGLQKAKEALRIDNLNLTDKQDYETFIKSERIRQSEIDSAILDGKEEVRKELMPLIEVERKQKEEERKQKEEERKQKEEERTQKEEERKLKEEAQNNLRTLILMMIEMNLSYAQIAKKINKTEQEIKDLIS